LFPNSFGTGFVAACRLGYQYICDQIYHFLKQQSAIGRMVCRKNAEAAKYGGFHVIRQAKPAILMTN
jgi:hypothetical protein